MRLGQFCAVLAVLGLSTVATVSAQTPARHDRLDIHHLPLGDGRVSSAPQRGYVWSCQTQFRQGGPGAQHLGAWAHGDTWDLTEKLHVQGRVTWPQAQFAIRLEGDTRAVRRLEGNGLPVNTPTGNFPVATSDPAFQIDRNPNTIAEQSIAVALPASPAFAEQPSCVPMGMIGIALNGVAIFNALDAGGRDAVAHEVQDLCNGHPERRGEYHYHGPSECLPDQTAIGEKLIGYAIDGFGITSMYDADGRELTNADLDDCHGRTSEIEWDGRGVSAYHYVLTREYPYTIGCFRGTTAARPRPSGPPPPR